MAITVHMRQITLYGMLKSGVGEFIKSVSEYILKFAFFGVFFKLSKQK
jgi:hypothetical protein